MAAHPQRLSPWHLFSFLVPVFLFGGCGDLDTEVRFSAVDSAGVTLISLPGGDVHLDWMVERLVEIPAAETEDEGFFGVTDVGALSGGRIAVLDGDGKKVVLFREDGTLLAQHGRQGSGPGEFQYPLELIPAPDGGLWVYDLMNARFERFDSTFSPLASEPLQGSFAGGHVAFAGNSLVLPTTETGGPQEEVQILSATRDPDTLEIVRYSRPRGGAIRLESCGLALSGISPLFSPRTLWASGPGGMVAVVGTGSYQIDVYREPSFQLERRIRRNVSPIPATKEMAELQVGEGMRLMTPAGERVCQVDEVVEKQGFASEIPPLSGVIVSPAGEIFLQRWAPRGEENAIDVLSPEGEYLGTLSPGFPFPQAFLDGDRYVVREEDEMEVPSVVIYRIVR